MPRGRIRMVCSFCRRRKIKCDMKMPCSACVKFKAECDYNEFAKNSPSNRIGEDQKVVKHNGKDEVLMLKERLLDLEEIVKRTTIKRRNQANQAIPELKAKTDSEINFNIRVKVPEGRYHRAPKQWGPFRWILLVSLDPAFHNIVRSAFNRGLLKPPGMKGGQAHHSRAVLSSSVLYGNPVEDAAFLREQIQNILPNAKVIWMLFDRFFSVVYPYVPILDEFYLRAAFGKLIGHDLLSEEPIHITPKNDVDFATLGILLMVLRLAYLSLFDLGNTLNSSTIHPPHSMQYLSQHEITEEFVGLAKKCLGRYDVMEENIFDVVQLTTLLAVYMFINPPKGGDTAYSTLTAVLDSMAYGRRLNRDPQLVTVEEEASPRWNMILRKIWYTLLDLDVSYAAVSGNCVKINPETHDVELPTFIPEASNIKNLELEKAVLESFSISDNMRRLLTGGLAMTGKLSGPVPLKPLMDKLEEAERFLFEVHEEIRVAIRGDPLNEADSFHRNSLLSVLSKVCFFLLSVYTHVYYYHIKRKDLPPATTAESKLISLMMQNIVPLLPMLLGHVKNPFAGSTDMFSSGSFVTCTTNMSYLLMSFSVKYKSQFASMKCNINHEGRLRADARYSNLFEALEKYIEALDVLMVILGNFYDSIKEKTFIYRKLHYGHRKLHEMMDTVTGSAEDKSYIRTSVQFLDGCSQAIHDGVDRVEFTALRQRPPPLETPQGQGPAVASPTLFESRMFELLDLQAIDELLEMQTLKSIV